MEKLNVFISYSHEDEDYKDKLIKHLITLKRSDAIGTWNDRMITAGEEWDKVIKEELERADIILLLVSIDFLNSNYSNEVELKRAVEKHDSGETVVIPVILRTCDWKNTSFSKIQALPKNGKPVKSFLDEDEALFSIAEGIKLSVKSIEEKLKKKENERIDLEKARNDGKIALIHNYSSDCDIPPNNLHWTGRQKEIATIDNDLHKVIFISGIGGQGKSGIASYYAKNIVPQKSNWEFWDWRDCKEKENRIHTKIISIIERITNGVIKANQISNASIGELIDIFFQKLENRKIVFIFDNIDSYMEFESFQLIGGVGKLYQEALNRSHFSKFIFTCRSTINDVHPELLNLRLQGLGKDDTFKLFQAYSISINAEQLKIIAFKSYEVTKGHPLWLNLIAAQARRGVDVVEKFISGIKRYSDFQEDDFTSILSDKILGVIWNSLNEKQKILLQAFAEIVRAETQDTLGKVLGDELNGNQFLKSFKTLKQLNLIVTKSSGNELDTYELHPLVREYVVQNFGQKERSKFISLFVNFYDSIILVLKSKISSDQPLSFFENWTARIELSINQDNYKSALVSLAEIADPIANSGYKEEYIRVANLLFINADWNTAINEEFSYFHRELLNFIRALTHFGKFDEAKAFFVKYQKSINNKGEHYINLCEEESHFYWFQSEFSKAIELANEAIRLREHSGMIESSVLKHTLALSLRDTKDVNNINKAIILFLDGKNLDDIINTNISDFQPEGYGNIGRCLQFLDRYKDAIVCYKKSLASISNMVNQGYGYMWLAECLLMEGEMNECLYFYKQSYNKWKNTSPVSANDVYKKVSALVELHPVLNDINNASVKKVNQFCSDWLSDNL
ncbi:hypothetical protein CDA63_14210 [Hymenobacter amundsenii]|uniref:TIR domain-containing protein n=1 Tax=Hymenobacter amundsenii TaxID=2006685 RepID=A0A246FIT9_9BACT|nr:TIR domain-containing protein [Hymenobacter amundsenii]OWP62438.1 hypothetical protein CDA63_14210 [Hymenobacter amundsenii]